MHDFHVCGFLLCNMLEVRSLASSVNNSVDTTFPENFRFVSLT